jgi:hypothetical protein
MKYQLFTFLIGLFFNFIAEAQEIREISGTIRDIKTNEVIPYAHLQIFNTNIGTVSNEDGEFILKMESISLPFQLEIQHISYKREKMMFSSFLKNNNLNILLESSTTQLEEIEINPISPEAILLKTIERFKKNHFQTDIYAQAYYKGTYSVSDWDYNLFENSIEAESVIEFSHPRITDLVLEPETINKIGLKNLKARMRDNCHPQETNLLATYAYSPILILNHGLYKSYSILDIHFMKYYQLSLDSIIIDELNKTWIISFKPKNKINLSKKKRQLLGNGSILIREKDFSIYQLNFEHTIKETLVNQDFSKEFVKHKIIINYQKITKGYYPKRIFYETSIKDFESINKDDYLDKGIREIIITMIKDTLIELPKNIAKNDFSFYTNSSKNDKSFFENYNIIPNVKTKNDFSLNFEPKSLIEDIVYKSLKATRKIEQGEYDVYYNKARGNKELLLMKDDYSMYFLKQDKSKVIFQRQEFGVYGAKLKIIKDHEAFLSVGNLACLVDYTKKEYSILTSDVLSPIIWVYQQNDIFPALPKNQIYFLNLIKAIKYCKSSINEVSLQNEEYYMITIEYPINKYLQILTCQEITYIRKSDFMPIKIIRTELFKNKEVITEIWEISNLKCNQNSESQKNWDIDFLKTYTKKLSSKQQMLEEYFEEKIKK